MKAVPEYKALYRPIYFFFKAQYFLKWQCGTVEPCERVSCCQLAVSCSVSNSATQQASVKLNGGPVAKNRSLDCELERGNNWQ